MYFESIDKEIEIHYDGRHDFSFDDAKQYEISVEEVHKLMDEIFGKPDPCSDSFVPKNSAIWEEFDIDDWGK